MRLSRVVGALLALTACVVWCTPAYATDYTTFHYDNARDGWNPSGGLGGSYLQTHFIQVANVALDGGEVDAQPLYVQGPKSPLGSYNKRTIFVVTEKNTLFAFWQTGAVRWTKSFGTPVPNGYGGGCPNTAPVIGIQSTPVIDLSTNLLYLVAYTLDPGNVPTYRLHAISTVDGSETIPPVKINPPGFNPSTQRQRAALLLSNGSVYVSFASFCDFSANASFGQVMSFSASTLALQNRFITTNYPFCNNYYLGSVWGSGFGPAADAGGNVYFSTGNGCIAYGNPSSGAFSQAVLKLTPSLQLLSSTSTLFAPCNAISENSRDLDLGSGGVSLLPDQSGSYPHLMVAGGKTGTTFVLNRDNLGGFRGTCPDTQIPFEANTNGGLWGGHVVYSGSNGATYVAVGGTGTAVNSYLVNANGSLSFAGSTNAPLTGEGGTSPIMTSSGTGVGSYTMWYLTRPPGTAGTINLVAYDGENLGAGPLVNVAAGTWANSGGNPFLSPTAVDEWVFVASNNQLTIWSVSGLRH